MTSHPTRAPAHPGRRARVVGLVLGLALLGAGCTSGGGGGEPSGGDDLAEELPAAETLRALAADADTVDDETRRTVPALAQALGGRVRFAAGTTEGCEGGSFDGATAAGYLVRARVDPGPDVTGEAAVTALSDGLAEAGWEVSEPNDDTPGRTVVGGRRGDAELSATVNEDFGQVLLTVAGPCRPVDDESRDDAIGTEKRQVIARQ